MIVLVGVVMWCPDAALGSSNCAVKRHLAAVALVLSWAEFVTLVARHPNLARYNIYVTMFYRSVDNDTLSTPMYSNMTLSTQVKRKRCQPSPL